MAGVKAEKPLVMDQFCEEHENLLISTLLQDLKVGRARLQEAREPTELQFNASTLRVNEEVYDLDPDNYKLYKIVVNLLLREFTYYPDVIGDFVYNSLNVRTNQHTSMDVLGVHSVMMRQWEGTLNKSQLKAHHLMGNTFKGLFLEVNNEATAVIRYRKKAWEFYSARQHTTEVALFAFLADMFNRTQLKGCAEKTTMISLCEKALPDWHPLIREDLSR